MRTNDSTDLRCGETRRHFELYADSEGNAETLQAVNRHLKDCERCAAWYKRQLRFEENLDAHLRQTEASREVWRSVEHRIRSVSRRRVPLVRLAAACFAATAVLVLTWGLSHDDSRVADQLATLAMVGHQRLVSGADPLQINSESDLKVEAYLRRRVDFPVRCPPRQDAGFVVAGGGVCSMGDTLAAYVHGTIGAAKASVFILPRDKLVGFKELLNAPRPSRVHQFGFRGLGIALAAIDQNVVIVVGPDSEAQLERVLLAYGTYPHRKRAA